MARTHMRWQFGAWDKPDHAETGKDARHLYMVICSDESINQAGVVTMRLGLWAEEAAMSDDEADCALEELEKRRFVVTDTRYAQLLVRSFIRNDEVYKQPNVLRSALSHAKALRSKPIKRVLAEELRKLPPKQADKKLDNGRTFVYPDPHATADEIDPDGPGGGGMQSSTEGSAKTSGNPSENPLASPDRAPPEDPQRDLFGEGFPEGSVEVVVEVEGEVTCVAPHQKSTTPSELARTDEAELAPAVPLTINKRAQAVTKVYYDTHGQLTNWGSIFKLVKAAIQDGWADAEIEAVLLALHGEGKTPTKGRLDYGLRNRGRRNGKLTASERARRTMAMADRDERGTG